jgi:CrcB protein
VARYLVSGWVHRLAGPAFPWGTLVVNVAGCFALGFLMGLADTRGMVSAEWRLFVGFGVLGSLTTFSTFGYETVELLRRSELALAAGSAAGNLVLGLGAVIAGAALARWWAG